MIIPASTKGLNNIAVPNVADVLEGWMTNVTAEKVTKTIVDGEVQETGVIFNFQGMIQPYATKDIELLAEGERHWEWVKVYTQYTNLKVDDKLIINQKTYRIMHKTFYEKFGYGFYRYDMVNDYTEANG